MNAESDGILITPKLDRVYEPFNLCPYDKVKVVWLCKYPHHKEGASDGLALSVLPHIKRLPKSLRSVLDEYARDLKKAPPNTGSLRNWAKQGVLLWNVIPTCTVGDYSAHNRWGWETLTSELVGRLSEEKDNLVFVLMGADAHQYQGRINKEKHKVIKLDYLRPTSKKDKFPVKGSCVFNRVNEYLGKQNRIDWSLQ